MPSGFILRKKGKPVKRKIKKLEARIPPMKPKIKVFYKTENEALSPLTGSDNKKDAGFPRLYITFYCKMGYSLIFSELMKKVPSGFTVRKKQDL